MGVRVFCPGLPSISLWDALWSLRGGAGVFAVCAAPWTYMRLQLGSALYTAPWAEPNGPYQCSFDGPSSVFCVQAHLSEGLTEVQGYTRTLRPAHRELSRTGCGPMQCVTSFCIEGAN